MIRRGVVDAVDGESVTMKWDAPFNDTQRIWCPRPLIRQFIVSERAVWWPVWEDETRRNSTVFEAQWCFASRFEPEARLSTEERAAVETAWTIECEKFRALKARQAERVAASHR
jgi:hypothetical protein